MLSLRFSGANLEGANLEEANLTGAVGLPQGLASTASLQDLPTNSLRFTLLAPLTGRQQRFLVDLATAYGGPEVRIWRYRESDEGAEMVLAFDAPQPLMSFKRLLHNGDENIVDAATMLDRILQISRMQGEQGPSGDDGSDGSDEPEPDDGGDPDVQRRLAALEALNGELLEELRGVVGNVARVEALVEADAEQPADFRTPEQELADRVVPAVRGIAVTQLLLALARLIGLPL